MAAICTTTLGNLGVKCDKGSVMGVIVGLIFATKTQKFDSWVNFADEAKMIEGIKAKNLFPINGILEFDDNSTETEYYTTALGIDIFLQDGKYKILARFDAGLEQNKEMQKFSGFKGRVYMIDDQNQIWGYSDDKTNVQGFSIANLKFENIKLKVPGTPGWSSMSLTLANAKELNQHGLILQAGYSPTDLESLSNVTVAVVGTPTTTELILSVSNPTSILDGDGAEKMVQMAGIPTGDFSILKASDGTAQTIVFTDNGDGTYTGAGTALEAGTANLTSPTLQTNEFLIESTEAVSFTV